MLLKNSDLLRDLDSVDVSFRFAGSVIPKVRSGEEEGGGLLRIEPDCRTMDSVPMAASVLSMTMR
jgi:hypothetical protein